VGKLSSSLSKVRVAALPREKTKTLLIKVRTGQISRVGLKNKVRSRASVGCRLGETESSVGRAWRRELYTRSFPFNVEDGGLVADNQLEGEAWCRSDDELLAWRRALYTRSTLIYVGVGRTSVAPSALHTLFSSATLWRAHNLLELGTDSHTEVVPAPQGGRLW
jgi:hypothetical protein